MHAVPKNSLHPDLPPITKVSKRRAWRLLNSRVYIIYILSPGCKVVTSSYDQRPVPGMERF